MKTLIITINSKYIHSSLAPWYLKAACSEMCGEVIVKEFTINENQDSVLSAIYSEKADVIAFSCYIWNIGFVHKLAENLKKLRKGIIIIFGGPEVSYDPQELLNECLYVDYIISGEGECPFSSLLHQLNENELDKLCNIKGITYRDKKGDIICNQPGGLLKLDKIESPYSLELLNSIKGKIAYFETSRGCPFTCSYCLSSTTNGVRFFPMDRIKKELALVARSGVRQVKFVDRTFNCNKERAREIFEFILDEMYWNPYNIENELSEKINYHFEIGADFFDSELLLILERAPVGLLQFEIGIQTMNERALEAVDRRTDIAKAFENIQKIIKQGNIHVHLDLIAGLPYEGYESFKSTFNKVYSLSPHTLQLGFLKLLKGSRIRKYADLHGYVYRSYAPYEILSNNYISYEELTNFKEIEELVDKYYNSGRFRNTVDYLIKAHFNSPFEFYHDFFRYISLNERYIANLPARELYTLLLEYAVNLDTVNISFIKELMKLDHLATDNSGHLPRILETEKYKGFQDECFDFLKNESMIARYLPNFTGMPSKQIFKQVHFDVFSYNVLEYSQITQVSEPLILLFDYSQKNPVSSRYRYIKINL